MSAPEEKNLFPMLVNITTRIFADLAKSEQICCRLFHPL